MAASDETTVDPGPNWTIGDVARRSGVNVTALRFYEAKGLIESHRTDGNQRRYYGGVLRRIAIIQAAQTVGFTLGEIAVMLDELRGEFPDDDDWHRLSASWRRELASRIRTLEHLRDQLDTCIGCGCLSLAACQLRNPDDRAGRRASGAVFWQAPDRRRPTESGR